MKELRIGADIFFFLVVKNENNKSIPVQFSTYLF